MTGEITQYAYDHRDRLTSAVTLDSTGNETGQAEYTYDAINRRIGRTANGQTERYLYNGINIALVTDESGAVTQRSLHSPFIDRAIAQEDNTGNVLYALSDHQGTVRDVVDSTGANVNHLTFDSFGNITSETDPSVNFRFSFTGREFDEQTGLYYFRARYLDPSTGQFISQDPIGFAAGDVNLYRYVGNSPLNFIDPSGNQAIGSQPNLTPSDEEDELSTQSTMPLFSPLPSPIQSNPFRGRSRFSREGDIDIPSNAIFFEGLPQAQSELNLNAAQVTSDNPQFEVNTNQNQFVDSDPNNLGEFIPIDNAEPFDPAPPSNAIPQPTVEALIESANAIATGERAVAPVTANLLQELLENPPQVFPTSTDLSSGQAPATPAALPTDSEADIVITQDDLPSRAPSNPAASPSDADSVKTETPTPEPAVDEPEAEINEPEEPLPPRDPRPNRPRDPRRRVGPFVVSPDAVNGTDGPDVAGIQPSTTPETAPLTEPQPINPDQFVREVVTGGVVTGAAVGIAIAGFTALAPAALPVAATILGVVALGTTLNNIGRRLDEVDEAIAREEQRAQQNLSTPVNGLTPRQLRRRAAIGGALQLGTNLSEFIFGTDFATGRVLTTEERTSAGASAAVEGLAEIITAGAAPDNIFRSFPDGPRTSTLGPDTGDFFPPPLVPGRRNNFPDNGAVPITDPSRLLPPSRSANTPSFSTVVTDNDAVRLEQIRQQLESVSQQLPRRSRERFSQRVQGSISETIRTVGFADVDVDGRVFTVGGFSGESDLPSFSPLLPESQRQLPTIDVNGRNRFSDAEVRILEQVLLETTPESTGSIRLIVNRLSCPSCSGSAIPEFQNLRPNLIIEVVQLPRR
nr:RHS repeat-associated core domain-containing protein [Synechococcus sp. PCC 7336]